VSDIFCYLCFSFFDWDTSYFTCGIRYKRLVRSEAYVYGSARLGLDTEEQVIGDSLEKYKAVYNPLCHQWQYLHSLYTLDQIFAAVDTSTIRYNEAGWKRYEFGNHLGNVLAVISDRKLLKDTLGGYFLADLYAVQDYDPFGMVQPGRSWKRKQNYRYAFNGKEQESTSWLDFDARMYDKRLGRFLSIDALAVNYPGHSPYHSSYNNPIIVSDDDGNENVIVVGGDRGKKGMWSHFLRGALAQYRLLKSEQPLEATTILFYTGEAKKRHYRALLKEAKRSGVGLTVVSSKDEIFNYINNRPGCTPNFCAPVSPKNVNECENASCYDPKERFLNIINMPGPRDLITDLIFIGHGFANSFWLMTEDEVLKTPIKANEFNKISPDAFSPHCQITFAACTDFGPRENALASKWAQGLKTTVTISLQSTYWLGQGNFIWQKGTQTYEYNKSGTPTRTTSSDETGNVPRSQDSGCLDGYVEIGDCTGEEMECDD
jgi:RHS repeat-associated protein